MGHRLTPSEVLAVVAEGEAFDYMDPEENCAYWEEVEEYPVRNFTELIISPDRPIDAVEWGRFFEQERAQEPERYNWLEKEWLRDPTAIGPVILAEYGDDIIDLGDGWHRVAISVIHGLEAIPAIVGRNCVLKGD